MHEISSLKRESITYKIKINTNKKSIHKDRVKQEVGMSLFSIPIGPNLFSLSVGPVKFT